MTTPPGQWSFTRWKTIGQLEALEVHHPLFRATLLLQGAHLISYAPDDQADWLWTSPDARYQTGTAVRGGIPLCWPWFGVPAGNPPSVRERIHTNLAHGFARTAIWKLEAVSESAHQVEISLSLDANQDFSELWQGRALALITFTFSIRGCQLALTTTNLDQAPLALTQALHTYLPTRDIHKTELQGLDGAGYTDTLREWAYFQQTGPVTFEGETDRIYESGQPLTLDTPGHRRTLTAIGSDSTVVWNPGPQKAKRLSDFPDDAWQSMVCVETANALGDYQLLKEGQSHTLGVMIGRVS